MKKNIVIVIVITIIVGLSLYSQQQESKNYKFIDEGRWIVEEGDTLWGIAARHSDSKHHDVRKVIDIIQELNPGLTGRIQPGQEIFVPLFENMPWTYHDEEKEVEKTLDTSLKK